MQMNLFTKQKQTHRLREQTDDCWVRERMRGRDSQGAWDGRVHTAMCKMDNQQGPTVRHRELCSMLRVCLDGKGV